MTSTPRLCGFSRWVRQLLHDSFAKKHACANEIWHARLCAAGLIDARTIEQYYDPLKQMFLPDRFIRANARKCGAHDQWQGQLRELRLGVSANELKNPYSAVSGATPNCASPEHFFFRLSIRAARPSCALDAERRAPAERNGQQAAGMARQKTDGTVSPTGTSRAIRPYFGFEIPNAPGKYFYVWLDAPIGYMGHSQSLRA